MSGRLCWCGRSRPAWETHVRINDMNWMQVQHYLQHDDRAVLPDAFTVPLRAFTPEQVGGTWDEVILATKAHHTGQAVRALAPHLSADGYVVSTQNGLNELEIAEVVGASRTVGAFVNFGADYLEPGVLHYGGRGAVVVGEIDGRITPRVTAIRDAWQAFDPRAIVTRTSGATCGARKTIVAMNGSAE